MLSDVVLNAVVLIVMMPSGVALNQIPVLQ
jgi:hypothetical protein